MNATASNYLPDCCCDPNDPTSDCGGSVCVTFYTTVFAINVPILAGLFVFLIFYNIVVGSQNRSRLWNTVLVTAVLASFGRTSWLGFRMTRTVLAQEVDLLFTNIYLYFGLVCFLSLLFFWARLYHDVQSSTAKKLFGRLQPAYIAALSVLLVVYVTEIFLAMHFPSLERILSFTNCFMAFATTTCYLVYGILIWKTMLKNKAMPLMFKVYMSAMATALWVFILGLITLITRFISSDTTHDYIIRHSLYEILYALQFLTMPL